MPQKYKNNEKVDHPQDALDDVFDISKKLFPKNIQKN